MATIGFPFEQLRPQTPKPKKSFLQRLNEAHDTLISNVRSMKVDDVPVQLKQPTERTRTPLRTDNQLSVASSITSWSGSERDGTQFAAKYSEINYDGPLSTGVMSPPLSPREGNFTTSFQQFMTPRDRKGSREFMQGMQNFMQSRQAAYQSSSELRPSLISPPQTPRSSHSTSSWRSSPSEMSDEDMDNWLERPMDAELHRFRKKSEASASWIDDATDAEEDIWTLQVIKEHELEEVSAALSEGQRLEEAHEERDTPDMSNGKTTTSCEVTSPKQHSTKVQNSKLLSLPDELLQNIAFHIDPVNVRPFRFSCMKLYDIGSASLIT
ncbi:hypothetical protein EJ02DRAFT_456148 [Clathrospora elynae]|uniref:F-box domain-containing protein n=1 Tax=Clathrospora elynae TaxID=706981 RepID=A0A6A5SP19_9PLEO|nr:hypothetical protein EJ02DRAFT_456148 [Clathrospora elynae]